MSYSEKQAQVTASEPMVNCAQPHVKPTKRTKKSKMRSNDESNCPSFSRSIILYNDISEEPQSPVDAAWSADEPDQSESERVEVDAIRKRPVFQETTDHLFGSPDCSEPQHKPRRHWELDTHRALFGPDGQIMVSERPRHYDIFELHRDMRIRRRKQKVEDTHGEVFGDATSLSSPSLSISASVNEDLELSDSELSRRSPKHYDVFDPYRQMTRRRQKRRRDAADTHGALFGQAAPLVVRKPVKNPARFCRITPKVVDDSVYQHLQPMILGDDPLPLKTGKAYFKPSDPPRNPVTGSGLGAPSRESIVMPDRARVLKAAADGVTVQYRNDRNPVTGDGMPTCDSNRLKQQRFFASQFVIADNVVDATSTPSVDAQRPKRRDGRRPSTARIRLFEAHFPVTGINSYTARNVDEDAKPVSNRPKSIEAAATKEKEWHQRKRQIAPPHPAHERRHVLAWAKMNGNVEDACCFIGDRPMRRRSSAHQCQESPITGCVGAAVDDQTDMAPGESASLRDYEYVGDDEDDDLSEDEDDISVARRRSA